MREYLNGSLAVIIDEHNQRAIEVFLDTADPSGTDLFWIGLTDLLHEGKFVWISGESATYTNWFTVEPSSAGIKEHFAHIYPNSASMRWNDNSNDKTNIFALCQFNL